MYAYAGLRLYSDTMGQDSPVRYTLDVGDESISAVSDSRSLTLCQTEELLELLPDAATVSLLKRAVDGQEEPESVVDKYQDSVAFFAGAVKHDIDPFLSDTLQATLFFRTFPVADPTAVDTYAISAQYVYEAWNIDDENVTGEDSRQMSLDKETEKLLASVDAGNSHPFESGQMLVDGPSHGQAVVIVLEEIVIEVSDSDYEFHATVSIPDWQLIIKERIVDGVAVDHHQSPDQLDHDRIYESERRVATHLQEILPIETAVTASSFDGLVDPFDPGADKS